MKARSSERNVGQAAFVSEKDVMGAVERQEPGTGDAGGEQPSLTEGDDAVGAGVRDQRSAS